MDHDALVEQIRRLAGEVEAKAGPVALFMLLASDADTDDAWNVVVSAQGFDEKSRGNAVREFSEWLRTFVDESQWPKIIRATVLRTDDPFVRAMNSAFKAEHSAMDLRSLNVVGVEIPKAILVESKRVAA